MPATASGSATERSAVDGSESPVPGRSRNERVAWWVFVAYLAVAFVAVLNHFGDGWWFYLDEWDYLADRNLTDPGDLLRPHNEHLTTLPIIVYRLLFRTFGLDSYLPYQAVTVATHLTAALLLRTVMRRAGATPWIATATAATLVLFGPGYENITWAFQMGFVGALTLGLAHLLLADHDGPLDHRDHAGVICGGLAVACVSGVGIVMVAIVGLATLLRRGWRPAAFHTLPLAAIYLLWWTIERPRTFRNPNGADGSTILRTVAEWDVVGVRSAFVALGSHTLVAAAIGLLLVVGTALALLDRDPATRRRELAAPAALLAGGPLFLTLSGAGRWSVGADAAGSSRYLYLVLAFSLPMLAVAATAVARRWRVAEPVVVVGVLLLCVANTDDFRPIGEQRALEAGARQQHLVALAASPHLDQVPGWVEPDRRGTPGLTVAWLVERRDEGDLPDAAEILPVVTAQVPVRLGVAQDDGPAPTDCAPLRAPLVVETREGDVLGIAGPSATSVNVVPVVDGRPQGRPVPFVPAEGRRLTITIPDLTIQLTPVHSAFGELELCR